jgi:hypothetical protein
MNDAGTAHRPPPGHEPDDRIPAYALGALDPDEARSLAAHLDGCPACRAALARHEAVVGAIGASVDPVPPAPGLRATLLAEIHEPAPAAAVTGRQRLITIGLGIAAALALISTVVLAVLLADLQTERDAARYAEREIAEYFADGGTLSALVPAPDAPDDVEPGHGSLAVAPSQNKAMLVIHDLPPSGDGRRYLAWAERDGERTRLGEVTVSDEGVGWLVFWPPEPMSVYETVGITRVSPDAPEGEPFLVAEVR